MPKLFVLLLFAGIVGVSCHRLIPATQPPFTITGIVESIDTHGLRLRHKTGQHINVSVTPQTAFVRRGSPVDPADLEVQMRVVILYHFVDGAATADQIRLFRRASE